MTLYPLCSSAPLVCTQNGGAIAAERIVSDGCSFLNSVAELGAGGAVAFTASAVINRTRVTGCSARSTGGAIAALRTSAGLTMEGGTIEGNTAVDAGGAICASIVGLRGVTFISNSAQARLKPSLSAGAHRRPPACRLSRTHRHPSTPQVGGAILLEAGGHMTDVGSVFRQCSATLAGGALHVPVTSAVSLTRSPVCATGTGLPELRLLRASGRLKPLCRLLCSARSFARTPLTSCSPAQCSSDAPPLE